MRRISAHFWLLLLGTGLALLGGCVAALPPSMVPPTAVLQADPTSGDAPLLVTFDLSGSSDPDGQIVQFTLDFGDGSAPAAGTDITQPVQHTYNDNGTYTATLTVTDDDGLTGQDEVQIEVGNPGPTAEFACLPNPVTAGQQVTCDASDSVDPAGLVEAQAIVSYEWDFGDGTQQTTTDPIVTHTYTVPGTYTVTLTVTDDDGATDTEQKVDYMAVTPAAGPEGTERWRFTAGSTPYGVVIGTDGTIYFSSADFTNFYLFALNPDGTEKWRFTRQGGFEQVGVSAPTIGPDGTIYFGARDNNLYAVNPDGTEKWHFTAGDVIQVSAAIGADGTIYFGSNDGNFYALNPDGSLKWQFPTGGAILCPPAVGADGTIYFGSWDFNLYALNPDGTEKWHFTLATVDRVETSPAIGVDGTIYFGASNGTFYALNPDGTEKWHFVTGGQIFFDPAIGSDGTIYFGSNDSNFYALNPDGTEKWHFTVAGALYSMYSALAIGADGIVYFGAGNGNFYALNPDGSERWHFTTGGGIASSPAIGADGTVYFGSYDYNLYAVWSSSYGLADSNWPKFQHDNQNTGREQ